MAKVRLVKLAHVYYEYRDLEKADAFLQDFGLTKVESDGNRIFYRGTGREPFLYCAKKAEEDVFAGAAFTVESLEDLILATKISGASKIMNIDAPGGGKIVTIRDPIDNIPFHLVHGQKMVLERERADERPFNFPLGKHRFAGQFQRFQKGPCPVYKLGHFGVCVTNFKNAFKFFTENFNLKPSDLVHDNTGEDVASFMHLDRGNELVDHHSFFIYEGPKSHIHHSSFEVHDFDLQVLGHDWLREKGYENCWGVGRHLLGSQIFDYWFDTAGFVLEHYSDGDMVNASTAIAKSKLSKDGLYIWGPDVPETFLQ